MAVVRCGAAKDQLCKKRQALLRCYNLLPRIVSLCEPPLAHLLSYTGGSSIRKDLPPREHHQIQELWSLWLRLQEPPRPQALPEGPVQGDPTPPGPSYSDPRKVGTGGLPAPPDLGSLLTASGRRAKATTPTPERTPKYSTQRVAPEQ